MSAIEQLPPLRAVIARHELAARKRLGQNFLLDLNLTRRIARAAGPIAGSVVIEVGPGPGGLTRALLLEGADAVIAIERDERCLPALDEIAAAAEGRLTIVHGDALKFEMAGLLQGRPAKIVANLPYNVATPLLVGWLQNEPWPPWYSSMTLMFQREVAERIVAAPGNKAYGRLAVLAQWRTVPRILFDIAPRAFTPPPKVTSSVVHFEPRPDPFPCDVHRLEQVVAAAFGQRRKMLRSSLQAIATDPLPLLEAVGIAPTERAEQLSVEQFCALARAFAKSDT